MPCLAPTFNMSRPPRLAVVGGSTEGSATGWPLEFNHIALRVG